MSTAVDTVKLRHTLLLNWPIERPSEQAAPREVEQLIAIGLMYKEDVGHGWTRYGLTDVGREVVRNGDVER